MHASMQHAASRVGNTHRSLVCSVSKHGWAATAEGTCMCPRTPGGTRV
jgi:hypothetical protein